MKPTAAVSTASRRSKVWVAPLIQIPPRSRRACSSYTSDRLEA
jgi:hypothetical protein